MAYLIIEGDPGQLESLLDELVERNYLPRELNCLLYKDESLCMSMWKGGEWEVWGGCDATIAKADKDYIGTVGLSEIFAKMAAGMQPNSNQI